VVHVHRFDPINHVVVMRRTSADAYPESVATVDDLFADGLAFLGDAAR
jgi:hypothetical protein